jgi:hypothetical protein
MNSDHLYISHVHSTKIKADFNWNAKNEGSEYP